MAEGLVWILFLALLGVERVGFLEEAAGRLEETRNESTELIDHHRTFFHGAGDNENQLVSEY